MESYNYIRLIKDFQNKKEGEIVKVNIQTQEYMIKNNIAINLDEDELIDEEEYDILKDLEKSIPINQHYTKDSEKYENEQNLSNFVFDENKVIKEENFVYCRINGEIGYGFYFEKMCDIYDKKGNYSGQEQRRVPIIITNKKRIIEIGNNLNINEKIRIRELPSEENYPLRWSREDIQTYLTENSIITQKEIKEKYEELKNYYKEHIYFNSEEWYDTHALWDIGTYFFMLFDYYPLIELRGQKGTGKTKVMSTSRLFTFNATEEMTNPSEATLFRETHDKRPTKYIDEAEKLYFFNPKTNHIEADPRAELINSGFKYSGSVPRQEKRGNKFITIYYKTYSPTMLGSINGLYGATEDRAIVHIMTKPEKMKKGWEKEPKMKKNVEKCRNFFYRFGLEFSSLVEKNYFNEENEEYVEKIARNRKEQLNFRDYNIWKPLLTIAKIIDLEVYDRIYDFALKQTKIKQDSSINEGTIDYKIIKALVILCAGHDEKKVYIKDVHDLWEGDNPPASKTIGNYIDKFGFRDYKGRDSEGTYYNVYINILKNIIYSTYSTFSSFVENEEKMKNNYSTLKYDILLEKIKDFEEFDFEKLNIKLKEKYNFNENQLINYLEKMCTEGIIAKVSNDKYRRL